MLFKKRFNKNKPPKDTSSVEFRRWMCMKIDGKTLKYILERGEDGVDSVIGKGGVLSYHGGILEVICGERTLFRADGDTLSAWEFMSLDGVTLTGIDLETGKERTVMCYYTYYRD